MKILFFSPITWIEIKEYGFRKTSGAMFKQLWERNDIKTIYFIQRDHRWGFLLNKNKIDSKVIIIGMPIGLPFERFNIIRKINRRIQSKLIKQYLIPCVKNTKLIYWFFDWFNSEIIYNLPKSFAVMELTDSAEQFHGYNEKFLLRLNRIKLEVVNTIDIIFTVSKSLHDEVPPGKCKLITMYNGINSEFLEKAIIQWPEPIEYKDIPKPRLCIIGTTWSINYRLDHEFLNKIANSLPNWNIIIIGCDIIKNQNLIELLKKKNVYIFKMQKQIDLIPFIQYSQVCTVPYSHVPFRDPLKVYEYLACNKPVILTVDRVRSELEPYVKYAKDLKSFIAACLYFNKSNPFSSSDNKIHKLLKNMTWRSRTEKCMSIITAMINEN